MAAPAEISGTIGGELILNPTSATGPAYGGTRLGTIQDVHLLHAVRVDEVTAEEHGGEVWDGIYKGEEWAGACDLANADVDGLQQAFYETVAGSGGTRQVVYPTSTFVAGKLRSAKAVGLLFAPREAATKLAVRCFAAALLPQEVRRFRFGYRGETRYRIAFLGLRDSSNRCFKHGLVADVMA